MHSTFHFMGFVHVHAYTFLQVATNNATIQFYTKHESSTAWEPALSNKCVSLNSSRAKLQMVRLQGSLTLPLRQSNLMIFFLLALLVGILFAEEANLAKMLNVETWEQFARWVCWARCSMEKYW